MVFKSLLKKSIHSSPPNALIAQVQAAEMAAVPQQQQSLQEQVARLTADVATLKATMEAQTEQFRAEFQAQIDALQAEEAWLSKGEHRRYFPQGRCC